MLGQNKKALLVGINKYLDSSLRSLKFSVNDASALNEILAEPERGGFTPEKCKLITDKNKTKPLRSNLMSAIQALSETAVPTDYILFFFSGHGIEREGKSYLLPSDARINVLCDTALPIDWVKSTLAASKARSKVLIFDACHASAMKGKAESGMMTKGFQDSILSPIEGFAVLSSCKMNEFSYEMPATKHGVFSYFLIEGLKGAADYDSDGIITVSDVSRYTAEKTVEWASTEQVQQTPNLDYRVVGDLILAGVPPKGKKQQITERKIAQDSIPKIPLEEIRLYRKGSKEDSMWQLSFCKTLLEHFDFDKIDYFEKTDRYVFPLGWFGENVIVINYEENKSELIDSLFLEAAKLLKATGVILSFYLDFDKAKISKWLKEKHPIIDHYDPKEMKEKKVARFESFLKVSLDYSQLGQKLAIAFHVYPEEAREKNMKTRNMLFIDSIGDIRLSEKTIQSLSPSNFAKTIGDFWISEK